MLLFVIMLGRFCFANGLAWLDPLPDGPNYTYQNDTLMNYSAIDHFISSPELLARLHISLYMFWMMVTIFLITWLSGARFSHLTAQRHQKNTTLLNSYAWDKADIGYYQSVLGFNLSTIALPVDALLCTNIDCQLHRDVIHSENKEFYIELISVLNLVTNTEPFKVQYRTFF